MGEESPTDTLGRRSGPRQRRSIEDKRKIVQETMASGSSVALVARKYEVNANQVFAWRRQYQQGLLEVRDAGVRLAMLPVSVRDEPRRRTYRRRSVTPPSRRCKTDGSIEIEFASGQRIRLQGEIDTTALAKVIELLSKS